MHIQKSNVKKTKKKKTKKKKTDINIHSQGLIRAFSFLLILSSLTWFMQPLCLQTRLIVLGFNDTSTLVGHFVSSTRERKKRDSRRDEREGQGRKRNRNESEETEEIKKIPPLPLPATMIAGLTQLYANISWTPR